MELNRTRFLFYGLTFLWLLLILTIGLWWLYLIFKLGEIFENPLTAQTFNFERFPLMIKWEGLTFLSLLLLLSLSLFFVFWQDQKKSRALQAFFASLTHEMRTPLASVRLQCEVIEEKVSGKDKLSGADLERLKQLVGRLIQASTGLEEEFDRSLELARLEQRTQFETRPLDLEQFISELKAQSPEGFQVQCTVSDSGPIHSHGRRALSPAYF